MDYAGGLRRLWLWEQAPCSDSFGSRLDEDWRPALTLSAPQKEMEIVSLRQPQHHSGHFCFICFNLFSNSEPIHHFKMYAVYCILKCFMGEQLQEGFAFYL